MYIAAKSTCRSPTDALQRKVVGGDSKGVYRQYTICAIIEAPCQRTAIDGICQCTVTTPRNVIVTQCARLLSIKEAHGVL